MKEHNYFVRTRDKIYQCIDDFIILKDQGLYIKHFQDHIIKIADTIEELCDEYVIVGTNWQQIIDLESARYNLKRPKELKVYGAIWTDKGLIYVAKMNDKGELELL